jgi:hypothetical protein
MRRVFREEQSDIRISLSLYPSLLLSISPAKEKKRIWTGRNFYLGKYGVTGERRSCCLSSFEFGIFEIEKKEDPEVHKAE